MALCLTAGSLLAMQAQEIPLVSNIYGRANTTTLNGQWHYIVDVQERGYYDYRMNEDRYGFFRDAHQRSKLDLVEYNFDTSPQMAIPGDWNTQDNQLFFYEGTVWFRRTFDYQPKAGKRTVLYFGAVNYEAIVYVNGTKMGRHVGGFTPFNFDITSALKPGQNNVIVKVDNKRDLEKIDGLSGLSPWILMDFRSPARYLPYVQDYFNRKGLISPEGQKKLSFYIMQQYYKKLMADD